MRHFRPFALLLILQLLAATNLSNAQNNSTSEAEPENIINRTPTPLPPPPENGTEPGNITAYPTPSSDQFQNDGPDLTKAAVKDDLEPEDDEKFKHLQNKTLKIVENGGEQSTWLQLPEGYSKDAVPPSLTHKKSPKVAVFINIRGINAIDMKTEKITLDLDLYEFWADPRFHPNHTQTPPPSPNNNSSKSNDGDTILVEIQKLHPDFVNHIWAPDLIMENCVIVPHNDLTSRPLVSFNTETGFIKYTRLEVTSPCPMYFFYYPLDTQSCDLTLRSYKHFRDQLELHWLHTGVFMGPEAASNSNFDIRVESATKEIRTSKSLSLPNLLDKIHFRNVIWADHSFDVLKLRLNFRRNVSFHVSQTYLPSTFFIAITWLCFLLPPGMAASRAGITMTTLLTINTMFNSVREHAPQVSYTKAIDVWMEACIFFTFLALFEFTFMSWLEHVKEREEKRKKEHEEEINKAAENVTTACTAAAGMGGGESGEKKVGENHLEFQAMLSHAGGGGGHSGIKMMDPIKLRRILRIRKFFKNYGLALLSAGFILFNAVYWAWICAGSEYFYWVPDKRFNE